MGQPEAPQHDQHDEAADDPQLQEALKAEGDTENLMAQAQRTWAEAQRATALLRKDRGFGHHERPPTDGKCFFHLLRQSLCERLPRQVPSLCPERQGQGQTSSCLHGGLGDCRALLHEGKRDR